MAPTNLPYTMVIRKTGGRLGDRELWYFRHASIAGPPPRLPGLPGEVAFNREYERLRAQVEGEGVAARQSADETSIRSLVNLYRSSDEWDQLADKTRADYDRELDRLCDMAGDLPFARLTAQGVQKMRSQVKAATVDSRKAAIAKRATEDAAAAAAGRKGSKRKPPAQVTKTTGARTADYFKSVLSALYGWAVENHHVAENPATGKRREGDA